MNERISPPPEAIRGGHCSPEEYEALYRQSIEEPDRFWVGRAKRLDWFISPTQAGKWSFDPVDIRWYEDGVLNLCHNCVDRHLPERADQVALLWEADAPGVTRSLTYRQLHAEVVRMAHCLTSPGVQKGDRVTLHLTMILEAAVESPAFARHGAVRSTYAGTRTASSTSATIASTDICPSGPTRSRSCGRPTRRA